MRKQMVTMVFLALCLLVLSSCQGARRAVSPKLCDVRLEEGEGFCPRRSIVTVRSGETAVFLLRPDPGYHFASVDYEQASVETWGGEQRLSLFDVRDSVTVHVSYEPGERQIQYFGSGALTKEGKESLYLSVPDGKLRGNTSQGTNMFSRNGYTLYAWNTKADGSGERSGLGSRIEVTKEGRQLYAMWQKWSDESLFETLEDEEGFLTLTGYVGEEDTLCIPSEIGGRPVKSIAPDAFAGLKSQTVILPPSLREIGAGAFYGADLKTLYLFDSLTHLDPLAFLECQALSTIHLNAATAPRFMTYFATFADKHDRLLSLKGEPKIVLFSGSSGRFGFDCPLLEESIPEYQFVNMGVFAYTNARPQMEIILSCMEEGDVLVHMPEFDASNYQFCTNNTLSHTLFCMMEANYDELSLLDLRTYDNVIPALSAYLSIRVGVEEGSYAFSPSDFDEDGNPSSVPTYNAWGDYVLPRPNAAQDAPIYGLPVRYTVEAFESEPFAESINAVYDRFLDEGIRVYFSYAPRNAKALSIDSTEEELENLNAWFGRMLHARVISDIEESLYSGIYMYGTDNHLSTEGVKIRTERMISDLQKALLEENE